MKRVKCINSNIKIKDMDIGVKVGQKFRASFPKFKNEYIECRLLSTTIENEGQGTIKVETLKRSKDEINNQYFKPGEKDRKSVV